MSKRSPEVQECLDVQWKVRLYALVGLAHTYAAAIEDLMFWCYVASTGQSFRAAARIYYRNGFADKADRTHSAVAAKLEGTEHASAWNVLSREIQELLGDGESLRNLLAHNPVQHPHKVIRGDGILVLPEPPQVSQSKVQVAAGRRRARTLKEAEAAEYCESLIRLYHQLDCFLEEALGCGWWHPERRAVP